jgi:transcriptional regulator GlxA family with amidase domain
LSTPANGVDDEPVRSVLIVAIGGCQLLDVAGPMDVFDAANRLTDGGYRQRVATPGGADVRCGNGVRLGADVALESARGPLDTLMVAGGLDVHRHSDDAALRSHLRRLARTARRVTSVCSGAELLAGAGLLDGRRATTHWAWSEQMQRRHPEVAVEADQIFVRDGNVATSAGVTAGMDLALALVEEDHGADVARAIARWLVLFLRRPGGQDQFVGPAQPVVPDGPLAPVVESIVADPGADHRLSALADRAAMSERHLTRRFLSELDTTPARFVERVRVDAARRHLEGDATVEVVARRAGFSSGEVMRRAFLRVLGIGPAEYRERFGPARTQWRVA